MIRITTPTLLALNGSVRDGGRAELNAECKKEIKLIMARLRREGCSRKHAKGARDYILNSGNYGPAIVVKVNSKIKDLDPKCNKVYIDRAVWVNCFVGSIAKDLNSDLL